MFNKIFTGFLATMLLSSVVLAGPGAKAPVAEQGKNGFTSWVETGVKSRGLKDKEAEEYREEIMNALRRTGKYSKEQLDLIMKGEAKDFGPAKQLEAMKAVKADKVFGMKFLETGAKIQRSDIARTAAEGMKIVRDSEKNPNKPMTKDEAFALELAKRDMAEVGRAVRNLGAGIPEVMAKLDKNAFPRMLELVKKLSDRVEKIKAEEKAALAKGNNGKYLEARKARESFVTKTTQMMVDAANAYKVKGLENEGILGLGADKCIAEYEALAIENLATAIRGGGELLEKTSKEVTSSEYYEAIGVAFGKIFNQDKERGLERLCATVGAPCHTIGGQTAEQFCAKRYGATAAR